MKKALVIDPEVLKRLGRLSKDERSTCFEALLELTETFGRPHAHTGLGIRKLGHKLLEARATIALRFMFRDRETDLYVSFLGNHDELKALLKSSKYR